MAAMPLHERRVIRRGAAAEVGHRNRGALQQGGGGHAAILALQARRGNGKKHLAGGPNRDRYVVGVPLLRRLATAVTSWAGANGFDNMMLCGTPFEDQSSAFAPPLM